MHHWSILITVQRDATQSSLFIILQVHSTCFGYQPHLSSWVHKTVTTVPGTSHNFCAATSLQRGQATQNCNYSLQYWSYFFVRLPPSNVAKLHKTVTTVSSSGHIFCAATSLQRGQATQNCNYSLRYWSYFFVRLPPSNVAKLRKTVTTASGTGHIFVHIPPSNVAKLDQVGGR